MIKLLKAGHYRLIETKGQTKILTLDSRRGSQSTKTYAWINLSEIGEILISSHHPHLADNILSLGQYRLYSVQKEPLLTDLKHLELFVGDGTWQGYLLPTGLPTTLNKRRRIIPTNELITKSAH